MPSEFLRGKDIEYYRFEDDFIEKNMRCIPMIVRLKMDEAGIKLRLDEWSRFTVEERIELAKKRCGSKQEAAEYQDYASQLILTRTSRQATPLQVNPMPAWKNTGEIPADLSARLAEGGWRLSISQWQALTPLQRFSLIKLCRPGHENRNFPKAIMEFGLA